MKNIYCKEDCLLTASEKKVFVQYLDRHGICSNVWELFQQWIILSNSRVKFFYLKVYHNEQLVGIGLFVKINPYDIRTSYSKLRKNTLLNTITPILSLLGRNCLYVSLRNLITANISRPFFYRDLEIEKVVMAATLSYLKKKRDADMVVIIDTKEYSKHYEIAGFDKYPCPSESWLEAGKYTDISEYLKNHKSLKKNISRKKNIIKREIFTGPMSKIDKEGIEACLDCSIKNSRAYNPTQSFFESNMFRTDVFKSAKYVHIVIRVDQKIAGFHTFIVSGSIMGGVLGGFNRKISRNNYVYERIIVASLDYAIKNKIDRVHYSLIDNFTKLRLVDSLEPCNMFFYSRSSINRIAFKYAFKYSDVYSLYLLENKDLTKEKVK